MTTSQDAKAIDQRRLLAWTALANLFLDTEHTDGLHVSLARDLRKSGYSTADLEKILRQEVAPVFGSNLLSVAGEWALWSEEEVAAIMQRDYLSRRRLTPSQWLAGKIAYPLVREEWRRISAKLKAIGD